MSREASAIGNTIALQSYQTKLVECPGGPYPFTLDRAKVELTTLYGDSDSSSGNNGVYLSLYGFIQDPSKFNITSKGMLGFTETQVC